MYKTIKSPGKYEQTITKSRFIARAVHVESEAEAMNIIEDERKRYPDSRHCCWAFVLGDDSSVLRYSDDGEPQGTAGLPMLDVIRKKGLTYTLITVVRYFGGVLLGTGGLTRAYSSSASGAVENGSVAEMALSQRMSVIMDYTVYAKLKNFIEKQNVFIDGTEYSDKVTFTITVKKELAERLSSAITDMLSGKCEIKTDKTFYFPWE